MNRFYEPTIWPSGGFGLGFEVHTRLGDSALVQASEGDTRFLRNQFRSMVQAAIID